jgi:hypothetical protein
MKTFSKFEDLKAFDEAVFKHFDEHVKAFDKEYPSENETNWELMDFFGGDVNFVESVEDLKLIKSMDDKTSLFEKPEAYDSCEEILDGRFVAIFIATNNGGGPTYLVPKTIYDVHPTVKESIDMTKNYWKSNEDHQNLPHFE